MNTHFNCIKTKSHILKHLKSHAWMIYVQTVKNMIHVKSSGYLMSILYLAVEAFQLAFASHVYSRRETRVKAWFNLTRQIYFSASNESNFFIILC